MLLKLLKMLCLEFIINEIRRYSNGIFYGWNCKQYKVITLYLLRKPIPCKDSNEKRYLYVCKKHKFFPDDSLTEEEWEWINTELIKIQKAAINAAAKEKSSITIDPNGHIEGTDVTVVLVNGYVDILRRDCGEDCIIISEDSKTTLKWDD